MEPCCVRVPCINNQDGFLLEWSAGWDPNLSAHRKPAERRHGLLLLRPVAVSSRHCLRRRHRGLPALLPSAELRQRGESLRRRRRDPVPSQQPDGRNVPWPGWAGRQPSQHHSLPQRDGPHHRADLPAAVRSLKAMRRRGALCRRREPVQLRAQVQHELPEQRLPAGHIVHPVH